MQLGKYTLRFYLRKLIFVAGWGIPAWFLVPVAETARIAHKFGIWQQNEIARSLMTLSVLIFIAHIRERKYHANELAATVDTVLLNSGYAEDGHGSITFTIPLWCGKMLHSSFNGFRGYSSTRDANLVNELCEIESKRGDKKNAISSKA